MSKLNIDQKSVKALFSEKKADFLIPDYQRPYAWGEKECQTLWDDLFLFAFPENDCDMFNSDSDEYFLGPIVTFKNSNGKMEIIDGQQRLTTLMLLLRAFYEKYGSMKNDKAVKTSKFIEQCIWKTDEFGDPDKSALKIDSEVATDKEKGEFLSILKTGKVSDGEKSNYASNYRFFQQRIVEFLNTYPDWFSFFPIRIMNNCILLPIEAESQDTFSNNRAITKAMLTWWAFQDPSQELLSLESVMEIEHIYARNRQEKEHSLSNPRNIESLGNKVLLEKRINIRASDYRFSDKVKYYRGFENSRKQKKEGTKIKELTTIAKNSSDFTETDIVQRNAKIIFGFVEYMHINGLLSDD